MCCSPHRFGVWAATHYHTGAWQTLVHRKECLIPLLNHAICRKPNQNWMKSQKVIDGCIVENWKLWRLILFFLPFQVSLFARFTWLLPFTLYHLGNFSHFFVVCWFFSKSNFSKNSFRNMIWVSSSLDPDPVFQEYDQSVKQFGSRSGPTFLSSLIWFQTLCKSYQQTALGDRVKELIVPVFTFYL